MLPPAEPGQLLDRAPTSGQAFVLGTKPIYTSAAASDPVATSTSRTAAEHPGFTPPPPAAWVPPVDNSFSRAQCLYHTLVEIEASVHSPHTQKT